eukprot:TRINITY_DN9143_c0_g1_i1.p1 TRINITY_DN9143_c0_g1~~TRINITY_DN9143_c0_g1_i1.p1  ORF type:complete len:223 (+),score=33.24 TRINITY_DN9143_c0_g1_i1:225-893(+)
MTVLAVSVMQTILVGSRSLNETLKGTSYTFDQPFHSYDVEQLVKDFIKDPNVQASLPVLATVNGSWTTLSAAKPDKVNRRSIASTALSMAFFDRLYEKGVLRPNGAIKGCIPEWVEGYEINSELLKTMWMEESEHYDIFDQEERDELIFKLFAHLVYGGPLNQYEDNIGPYFDITRDLYKDLVSVAKDPSGKLYVNSVVVRIDAQVRTSSRRSMAMHIEQHA